MNDSKLDQTTFAHELKMALPIAREIFRFCVDDVFSYINWSRNIQFKFIFNLINRNKFNCQAFFT